LGGEKEAQEEIGVADSAHDLALDEIVGYDVQRNGA
jgi:hypothetical protein